jgi:hypothetical protein
MSFSKIQNGGGIKDGVKRIFIFQPIFSKMMISQFFYFLFILGKNKNFIQKKILESSVQYGGII